jgi:tetratricopeptide (TPR) repeat protein
VKVSSVNIRIWLAGVAVAAALAPSAAVAQAESLPWQLSQKFPINETDPEASVPSPRERDRNPLEFGYLLQDLIEGAEMARKAGDYQGVVHYYRAIVKGAPERAKGWSKLCEAYALVNDHQRAATACGSALSRPGVELQDYTRFVHETLLLPGKPTPANAAKLKDVLAHLDQQPNIELATAQLRCEVGVALGDSRLLEAGTAAMTRLAPKDPKTVIYQWTLAMQRGQTEAAGRLLKQAKGLNLPPENLERMQALTAGSGRYRYVWTGLVAAASLLLAGGVLLLARRRRGAALAPAAR